MQNTESTKRALKLRGAGYLVIKALLSSVYLSSALLLTQGCGTGSSSGNTDGGSSTPAPAPQLVSGTNTLTLPATGNGTYSLLIQSSTSGSLSAASANPVTVYVCQGTPVSSSTETGTCPTAGQKRAIIYLADRVWYDSSGWGSWQMLKCGVRGCTEKVIGGFQEIVDTGNFQDPHATELGMRRFWCGEHEDALTRNLGTGRFFTAKQLKEMRP